MIHLIGTSHIAQESVLEIKNQIRKIQPSVVAVELDELRLQGLMNKKKGRGGTTLIKFISMVQSHFSEKTGIFPGEEMLTAVKAAHSEKIPIALIDQNIETTLEKIKRTPLKERLKLGLALLAVFLPIKGKESFDLNKVPEQELITRLLVEFKKRFPGLYFTLVEERNTIMAHNLLAIEKEYENVVAVVGAGHVLGMREILDKSGKNAKNS